MFTPNISHSSITYPAADSKAAALSELNQLFLHWSKKAHISQSSAADPQFCIDQTFKILFNMPANPKDMDALEGFVYDLLLTVELDLDDAQERLNDLSKIIQDLGAANAFKLLASGYFLAKALHRESIGTMFFNLLTSQNPNDVSSNAAGNWQLNTSEINAAANASLENYNQNVLASSTPHTASSIAFGVLALTILGGAALACRNLKFPSAAAATPHDLWALKQTLPQDIELGNTCPLPAVFDEVPARTAYFSHCETGNTFQSGGLNATAADVISRLNNQGTTIDNIRSLSNVQLHQVLTSFHVSPNLETAGEIVGTPTGYMARFIHDPTLAELERIALFKEMGKVCNLAGFDELLAKAIVNREMQIGTLLPVAQATGSTPMYYQVARLFITGHGMVAYALEPATDEAAKTLSKMIIFRGSVFFPAGLDSISTYYNDLEEHLGLTGFESGRQMLGDYLQTLSPGEKIRAVGHSLGGAQAQWFTAAFPESIGQLVTFNAPGLPKDAVAAFRKKVDESDLKLNIDHFRTQGDVVDKAGDHLLSGTPEQPNVQTTLTVFEPKPGLKYDAHKSRFLGRNPSEYTVRAYQGDELEYQLENRAGRGKVMSWLHLEDVRRTIGFVAAPILNAVKTLARATIGSRVTKFVP